MRQVQGLTYLYSGYCHMSQMEQSVVHTLVEGGHASVVGCKFFRRPESATAEDWLVVEDRTVKCHVDSEQHLSEFLKQMEEEEADSLVASVFDIQFDENAPLCLTSLLTRSVVVELSRHWKHYPDADDDYESDENVLHVLKHFGPATLFEVITAGVAPNITIPYDLNLDFDMSSEMSGQLIMDSFTLSVNRSAPHFNDMVDRIERCFDVLEEEHTDDFAQYQCYPGEGPPVLLTHHVSTVIGTFSEKIQNALDGLDLSGLRVTFRIDLMT